MPNFHRNRSKVSANERAQRAEKKESNLNLLMKINYIFSSTPVALNVRFDSELSLFSDKLSTRAWGSITTTTNDEKFSHKKIAVLLLYLCIYARVGAAEGGKKCFFFAMQKQKSLSEILCFNYLFRFGYLTQYFNSTIVWHSLVKIQQNFALTRWIFFSVGSLRKCTSSCASTFQWISWKRQMDSVVRGPSDITAKLTRRLLSLPLQREVAHH